MIIDTLGAASTGEDENDARFGKVLVDARMLAQKHGTTTIFVHHLSKAGDVRGSSSLKGNPDVDYRVTALGNRVTVTCAKMKQAQSPEPFVVDVSRLDIEGLKLATETKEGSPGGSPVSLRALIHQAVTLGQHRSKAEVARAVGRQDGAVCKEMNSMKTAGELVCIDRVWKPDDAAKREQRVVDAVNADAFQCRLTTEKKLATEAHVSAEDVQRLLRNGVISPRSSTGRGGYVVGGRE